MKSDVNPSGLGRIRIKILLFTHSHGSRVVYDLITDY